MKKITFNKLMWLLAAIPFLFACDDNAPYYGEGIDSEFNLRYSSKTYKYPSAGTLELTYSDSPLIGKDIYFNMMTENTAKIKFFAIFPGEAETIIENVTLKKTTDGYSIDGSYKTAKNTSFNLRGNVRKLESSSHLMKLDITDVRIENATLSAYSPYKTVDYNEGKDSNGETFFNTSLLFEWTSNLPDGSGTETVVDKEWLGFAYGVASCLLYLAIEDLTFHPDGNITATYAPLPPDINYQTIIYPWVIVEREETNISPLNLITYYFDENEDGSGYVYIRPNIEQIVQTVIKNQAATRTESESNGLGGMNIGEIFKLIQNVLALYDSSNRWLSEGFRFNYTRIDRSTESGLTPEKLMGVSGGYFTGDKFFYLDNYELKIIVNSFSALMNILDIDIDLSGNPEIPAFINEILEGALEKMNRTEEIKVGLILHEN